jgi:hypothetical protein
LEFPELGEDGDDIHVTLRNPQTVPFDALVPKGVVYDANGNAVDQAQFNEAMFEVYAFLISDWRVYDATSLDEDQPLLPSPATGTTFAKLPRAIQNRIADEVNARRNPTTTPTTTNS